MALVRGIPAGVQRPRTFYGVQDVTRSRKTIDGVYPDRDYNLDEIEFLSALECWKKKYKRKFPSSCDVLAIIISLGYRKVYASELLPPPRSIVT